MILTELQPNPTVPFENKGNVGIDMDSSQNKQTVLGAQDVQDYVGEKDPIDDSIYERHPIHNSVNDTVTLAPSPSSEEASLLRPTTSLDGLLCRIAETQDKLAFTLLFKAFAPRIRGFFYAVCQDKSELEDMIQDFFLKLWRKANLFNAGKSSAETWLFTMARNYRIDWLRRLPYPTVALDDSLLAEYQSMDTSSPFEAQTDNPSDGIAHFIGTSPDAIASRNQTSKILNSKILSLPRKQQDMLVLAFKEGLSHRAIAAQKRLPLGTVKSRMRAALKALADTLNANNF